MTPRQQMDQPPLGYADLEDDEALIVTLYRHWCSAGPTAAIAEHRIAVMLRHDNMHAYLDAIFGMFRHFGRNRPLDGNAHAVLHPDEEDLLDFAAQSLRPETNAAPADLRRIRDIPRSGQDEMERLVAQGYFMMTGMPSRDRQEPADP
jgi:hypothetical protein